MCTEFSYKAVGKSWIIWKSLPQLRSSKQSSSMIFFKNIILHFWLEYPKSNISWNLFQIIPFKTSSENFLTQLYVLFALRATMNCGFRDNHHAIVSLDRFLRLRAGLHNHLYVCFPYWTVGFFTLFTVPSFVNLFPNLPIIICITSSLNSFHIEQCRIVSRTTDAPRKN